jgi:large subunit ribosomal protein L21
MYAIIEDRGRQFKIQEGQEIDIDFRGVPKGSSIQFDRVLTVSGEHGVRLGQPTVAGATVSGEVLGARLGDKIYIQKLRRRKTTRRRTGHRQVYTRVRIQKIEA